MSVILNSENNYGINPSTPITGFEEVGNYTYIYTDDCDYLYNGIMDENGNITLPDNTNINIIIHGDSDAENLFIRKGGTKSNDASVVGVGMDGYLANSENEPIESICVIPKQVIEPAKATEYAKYAEDIRDNAGLSNQEINIHAYSSGACVATPIATEIINNNSETPPITMVFHDAAGNGSNISLTPDQTEALQNNGAKVIAIEKPFDINGDNKKALRVNFSKFVNAGIDTLIVGGEEHAGIDSRNTHGYVFSDAVANGIMNSTAGNANRQETFSAFLENTMNKNGRVILGTEGAWNIIDDDSQLETLTDNFVPKSEYIPSASPTIVNGDVTFDLNTALSGLGSGDHACVYRDELDAFLNSPALSALENDVADAESLNALVESFKSNSILKGEPWTLAYEKFDKYDESLKERAEAASELGTAIREAITELQGCMTEYDKIDTNELPELEESLSNMETRRDELESKKYRTVTTYDENGKPNGTETVIDQDVVDAINEISAAIEETKKLIAAINKLQETYDRVIKNIEKAMAKVNQFSNTVANITPSNKYIYTK